MSKVILFGVKDFAELASYYISTDSDHIVVGFTVDKKYIPDSGMFLGKPVVPFEDINQLFPPDKYKLFAPMSPVNMNHVRKDVYLRAKIKGYEFISYVSSKATVCDNEIGENCFILENNTLQPFTTIGNNVVLWSGNHIGHHGRIKDHVFFASHVVMSGHCVIEPFCFLGVNSTIRDDSHLAKGTLIAMGATLTKQITKEWGVYLGNPAKLLESKLSKEIL